MRSSLLTSRSRLIMGLLPALRAGIRRWHLRTRDAEEALQQSLLALVPHMDLLAGMPERKRAAYAFSTASHTAMALRKQAGLERARSSGDEVYAWEREVARRCITPEEVVRAAEGAAQASRAFEALAPQDKNILTAINDEGLSERDAARELGMSRGNVSYRLRRARDVLARAWFGTTS
ncbi:sigma-70 family RNA polymerase sigma factor [Pendulispora albinea]|uniref:Sigma-70 family RNA polymerase sigma factor n=1 Tax=Pendulispora albinea TaxID=2741071 RepID=A0ABZ2M4J9_9BACT